MIILLNPIGLLTFLEHFRLVNDICILVTNRNQFSKYLDSPSQELHNHSNNISDWFQNWYLIRFDQSAGSSQGVNGYDSVITPHSCSCPRWWRPKSTATLISWGWVFDNWMDWWRGRVWILTLYHVAIMQNSCSFLKNIEIQSQYHKLVNLYTIIPGMFVRISIHGSWWFQI